MALSGAPATTAIVASLPAAKQGIASAMNDVSRELGGALGIAVLGSILNTGYRSSIDQHTAGLPPAAASAARSSIAAAGQVAHRLGGPGQQLMAHAQAAFAHGLLAGTDFAQPLLGALAWLTAAVLVIVAFRRLTASRGRQSPARSKTVAIP